MYIYVCVCVLSQAVTTVWFSMVVDNQEIGICSTPSWLLCVSALWWRLGAWPRGKSVIIYWICWHDQLEVATAKLGGVGINVHVHRCSSVVM